MSKSTRVRLRDLAAAHRLIGECREQGDDARAWREHMCRGLLKLFNAQVINGGEGWIGQKQGGGWYLAPTLQIDLGWKCDAHRAVMIECMKNHSIHRFEAFQLYAPQTIGRTVTRDRRQLLSDEAWYNSFEFNIAWKRCELDDFLASLCVKSDGFVVNLIKFHRELGARPFTTRERRLLHLFHVSLTPLIGRVLAVGDEPAACDLSPRLRQIHELLLDGQTEKQIAASLDLSPTTVHGYVGQVYEHFYVTSRTQLMATFLQRWRKRRSLGEADADQRGAGSSPGGEALE